MSVVIFGGESDMAADIAALFEGEVVYRVDQTEADVRDLASVIRTIKSYTPSVIINLAGVSHLQPLKDSNQTDWYEEINTNLIGSYNVARAGLIVDATMIFIGSVAGKYGKANHSGYCASKAGVISLVQSLGMEGHKAYCISPGRVDTKMRERDFPGEDRQSRLTTQEIAGMVQRVLDGEFEPGHNVIIRKKGYETLTRLDSGEPWKGYLNVRPL